jgi:hypothetical protein
MRAEYYVGGFTPFSREIMAAGRGSRVAFVDRNVAAAGHIEDVKDIESSLMNVRDSADHRDRFYVDIGTRKEVGDREQVVGAGVRIDDERRGLSDQKRQ